RSASFAAMSGRLPLLAQPQIEESARKRATGRLRPRLAQLGKLVGSDQVEAAPADQVGAAAQSLGSRHLAQSLVDRVAIPARPEQPASAVEDVDLDVDGRPMGG